MRQVKGGSRAPESRPRPGRTDVVRGLSSGTSREAAALGARRVARRDIGDAPGLPDFSRLLANRLVATLEARPFRPTAAQLEWVWGGDLVRGEAPATRARIAACRYAGLFTDHVVQDLAAEGAPGAYATIWLCARSAFIASVTSGAAERPPDGDVAAWENEGGAAS